MPALQPIQVNFDGLIGPTHNYAGLARGNLASQHHGGTVSNPRQAALEGLKKMKFLADLGLVQAVLPPQERPDLQALRRLGFSGSDARVLESAAREYPGLLAACYSASSMWAANAATVSPSADMRDGRVHFTPANLVSQFHRSLESATTSRILRHLSRRVRLSRITCLCRPACNWRMKAPPTTCGLLPIMETAESKSLCMADHRRNRPRSVRKNFPPVRHCKRHRQSPGFINSITGHPIHPPESRGGRWRRVS